MSYNFQKLLSIGFAGKPLSAIANEMLYKAACYMAINEQETYNLISDDASGVVETDFSTATIGPVSGVLFKADIDTPRGNTKINFIVRTRELEESEGVEWLIVSKKIPKKSARQKKKKDDGNDYYPKPSLN